MSNINSFDKKMQFRLKHWYINNTCGKKARELALLTNKIFMREFCVRRSIPLPEIYYSGDSMMLMIESLRDKESFVIKPSNSADSDGVILFKNKTDLFTGVTITDHTISDYISNVFSKAKYLDKNTLFISEEFIKDFDCNFTIPRDFKLYCAGGKVKFIQVIDRNPIPKFRTSAFFDSNLKYIDDPVQCTYTHVSADIALPSLATDFSSLIKYGELISAEFPVLLRLDFFMSKRGPLFGEFTTYPFAGKLFSDYGCSTLSSLMEAYPDSILD
jgi:hypothetical protein